MDFENPGNLRLISGGATQVAEELQIVPSELIRRCSLRPADELAWSEFVRCFTPTIRVSIEKSLQLKETEGEHDIQNQEAMIEKLIRMVYFKLTEQRSQGLRQLEVASVASLKTYLKMVSINVVREALRHRE